MQTPYEFFKALEDSLPDLKNKMLTVIKVETGKFVNDNFEKGGFQGASFEAWQPRKDSDTTRRLLVESGALRNEATTGEIRGGGIAFVMNLPYAQIHNEGGTITQTPTAKQKSFFWKQYYASKKQDDKFKAMALATSLNITIPKRQFIGESPVLNERIKKKFESILENHFKNL